MRTVNAKCGAVIPIGRLGENEAAVVVFDVAEWIELFGAGTFSLLHQRSGDPAPYPCSIEYDGNTVTWTVTSADVAVQGYGRCELIYTVGDVIAKSVIYTTVVGAALTGGAEPPEPWEDWVERVLQAGASAVEAAASAEASAETATQEASAAASSASAAQSAAESAEEAKAEWENMTAEVETLPAGHNATASYADGVLSLGIPQGATGQQGTQGVPGQNGADGADGVTFTPAVDAAGNISWTNDGGRENPPTRNIKGAQGAQGVSGVYVGSGDMPEGYNVQIDPTAEAPGILTEPETFEVGDFFRVKEIDENGHAVLEAAEIDVPSNTSDLTNDSGFITEDDIPVKSVSAGGTAITPDENGNWNVPIASNFNSPGVVLGGGNGFNVASDTGRPYSTIYTKEQYNSVGTAIFVGKGTLENIKSDLMKRALTDTTAPAWTPAEQKAARDRIGEGQFELIDTITLTEDVARIERTQEPDGTPYNYKNVIIVIEFPITTSAIRFTPYVNDIAFSASNFTTNASAVSAYRVDVSLQNNTFFGLISGGGSTANSHIAYSPSPVQTAQFSENINRIRVFAHTTGTSLPTGTTISIYAVRA